MLWSLDLDYPSPPVYPKTKSKLDFPVPYRYAIAICHASTIRVNRYLSFIPGFSIQMNQINSHYCDRGP
jgi:hypothetical protein